MNIITVMYSDELLRLLMSMPREKENIQHVNKLLSSKAVRIKNFLLITY